MMIERKKEPNEDSGEEMTADIYSIHQTRGQKRRRGEEVNEVATDGKRNARKRQKTEQRTRS